MASERPILHHLNADSTWLLQVPDPGSSSSSRQFFNILIDPWLSGPQSDVASWFSQQYHATPSAYTSIAEVQELAGTIDVVTISHELTDHCHKETLMELPTNTPVYGPSKAAKLIRSWKHFDTVVDMPFFEEANLSDKHIPPWLWIERVQDPNDALYYHSAILISWPSTSLYREYVLYTPHGVAPSAIERLALEPHLTALCLIHGMHNVKLYGMQQLNLGGDNGLALYRRLQPKYWVGTHDEVKTAGGIVKYVLWRSIVTIEEALSREKKPIDKEVPFIALENGAQKVLS
jgi:hypothetical protein